MQAFRADRAALAAAILARQLESQQPLGPAQPIKSLLGYSPDQHAHSTDSHRQDADASQQAAATEASPGFSTELSAEVVWQPELEDDSQLTQLAMGDEQTDSEGHVRELLQVPSKDSIEQPLEAASQHHQGSQTYRQQTSDMDDEQALQASGSLQLLDSTQSEAEATSPVVELAIGSSEQLSIAEPYKRSSLQDHRPDSKISLPDYSRRSPEQPPSQSLPDLHQDITSLCSADQQQFNGGSQYLQELQHQQQLRAQSVSSSPESRQGGNPHVSALGWAESDMRSDTQHDSTARIGAEDQYNTQSMHGLESQVLDQSLLAEGQAISVEQWSEAQQMPDQPQDDEAVTEQQLEAEMQSHLHEAAAVAEGPSACNSPDRAEHLVRAAAQSPAAKLNTRTGASKSSGDASNAVQPWQEQQQEVSTSQKGTSMATAMIQGMSGDTQAPQVS